MTATTKRKQKPAARKPDTTVATLICEQLKDPIFAAIRNYNRALGAFLVNEREDDKTMDRLGSALFAAEMAVAETVPTTQRGIEASARWMNRFIAWHGGPENLDGHQALKAWPGTIHTALRSLRDRPDPIDAVIANCQTYRKRINSADEKTNKTAYERAEREWLDQLQRFYRTAPETPHGIATALEFLVLEESETGSIEAEAAESLRLIAAAARAMC